MNLPDTITNFLVQIGINVHYETIDKPTFLPGLLLRNGEIVIDKEKLLYPGDILHEAGHLAVMPVRIRQNMSDDLEFDPIHQGGELAAMAWSYAACIHLGIDPYIVFHEEGYKGGGNYIADQYKEGSQMGVYLLAWQQMTSLPGSESSEPYFPAMKEWLCSIDKYAEAGT